MKKIIIFIIISLILIGYNLNKTIKNTKKEDVIKDFVYISSLTNKIKETPNIFKINNKKIYWIDKNSFFEDEIQRISWEYYEKNGFSKNNNYKWEKLNGENIYKSIKKEKRTPYFYSFLNKLESYKIWAYFVYDVDDTLFRINVLGQAYIVKNKKGIVIYPISGTNKFSSIYFYCDYSMKNCKEKKNKLKEKEIKIKTKNKEKVYLYNLN